MPVSMLTWNQDQWCQGELANCPILCGGQAHNKVNTCTGVSPPRILRAVASPLPTPSQTISFSHSQSLDQSQHLLATIANGKPFPVFAHLHLHLQQRYQPGKHSGLPRYPSQPHLPRDVRPVPCRQPRLSSLQDLWYPQAYRRPGPPC